MIQIYKYISILLIPFILINIFFRIKKGKEINDRYKERFGQPSRRRPSNNLIWIHAASIGEFKSADIIINSLHKNYTILVTTTTVSAANFANKYYGDKIIHQFAPLDVNFWVKKFLLFWQPCLVIWIESDLWPITLQFIKKMNIRAILVNVRISPQSFNKWKKLKFFYKQITDSFSEIFAQSEIDKKRISELTKREVRFIGNLKFASLNKNFIFNQNKNFNQNTKLLTLMFVSTHAGEEVKFLPILKKLLDKYKNLSIIIAPRHPERSNEIQLNCNSFQIKCGLENEEKSDQQKVLIINSYGHLSKYFELSDIVFLGGSLISKGGHNPIEPSIYGCVIITGPYIFNWQNIYDDMIAKQACYKIKTIKDLENKINILITNKDMMDDMKINAYNHSKKQFFNKENLLESINNQLNKYHAKSA